MTIPQAKMTRFRSSCKPEADQGSCQCQWSVVREEGGGIDFAVSFSTGAARTFPVDMDTTGACLTGHSVYWQLMTASTNTNRRYRSFLASLDPE